MRHHIEIREEGAQRGLSIATDRSGPDGPGGYRSYLTALAEALEGAAAEVRRRLANGKGQP